jgi:hypothetical protein
MSDEEINKLEENGIIGTVPTPDVLGRIPKSLPESRTQEKPKD